MTGGHVPMFLLGYATDPTDVCLWPYVISGHVNHYKGVYCLLQKICRQLLKKATYLTTRPGFLAQGKAKALGGKAKAKALGCKADVKNFGLKAKV